MQNKPTPNNPISNNPTPTKLTIVADDHIWGVEAAFSNLPGFDVNLRLLQNKQINRACLNDADILLTRSATRVNAELLTGTPVRFAATATIGDDHYDKLWLDSHDIAWANAAGSSTGSVLEYMLTVLFELHERKTIDIEQTTIGIIGAGRIGGALAILCEHLGMKVLRNDPPRARQGGNETFYSLDEILMQADILSMHTPLIHHGEDCTVHLLSQLQMQAFRGKGIINAGRGSCLDNIALCSWLDEGHGRFAVLDCWEDEPTPLCKLINHNNLAIATPHIAGHSVEGKAANTQYIYNALCQFLNIQPTWDMTNDLPAYPSPIAITDTQSKQSNIWKLLHAASSALYPISNDDQAMRSWANLSSPELAKAFTTYRRNYPARRAWQHAPIILGETNTNKFTLPQINSSPIKLAQAIGFKVV